MKRPSSAWWSNLDPSTTTSAVATLFLLVTSPGTTAAAAATVPPPLACDNLVVDGHKYNLQALAGPHTVVTHEYTRPTYHNTTYTIDICGPLKRKGDDVPAEERCPDGTRGKLPEAGLLSGGKEASREADVSKCSLRDQAPLGSQRA